MSRGATPRGFVLLASRVFRVSRKHWDTPDMCWGKGCLLICEIGEAHLASHQQGLLISPDAGILCSLQAWLPKPRMTSPSLTISKAITSQAPRAPREHPGCGSLRAGVRWEILVSHREWLLTWRIFPRPSCFSHRRGGNRRRISPAGDEVRRHDPPPFQASVREEAEW